MFSIVNHRPSAKDVFSLTVVDPPRWRFLGAVLVNFIGQSMGTDDGGGHRAIFRRRESEDVVGEFVEPFVGASSSTYAVVLADYSTMSADDFERTWLTR